VIKNFKDGKENDRKELIHKYESRIDSINTVNYMLAIQTDSLEKQIIIEQSKKTTIYIETVKKNKEIKDATAVQHAQAIDTLTGQLPTWAVVKDTITQDTLIHYKFTKPGVVKLRLTVNDLYKYKKLYNIDEGILHRQKLELDIYKEIANNDKDIIKMSNDALKIAKVSNDKLTKQLNKVQKRASRWPYWVGAGFIGGIVVCLSVQ
jgi:hypothetical protein